MTGSSTAVFMRLIVVRSQATIAGYCVHRALKDQAEGSGCGNCSRFTTPIPPVNPLTPKYTAEILLKPAYNNINNLHLLCTHQRPERSHDTY